MVLSRQLEKTGRVIAFVALFCGTIILLLWVAIFQQLEASRASDIETAQGRNANLAVSLEQYAIRTIHNADALIQLIRLEYVRQGSAINLDTLMAQELIDVPYVLGVGILDPRGRLLHGDSSMRASLGMDLSDRAHFRFHLKQARDSLFLGTPIFSRTINRVVIPLSRRIIGPGGRFAGTVCVQIEPRTFTFFYAHAAMRPNDLMSLIAPDGTTYARRTGNRESQGENISSSPLFKHVAQQPVGNYYARDAIRGIPTYFSYRKLESYPMIATVGVSEEDVLTNFHAIAKREYLFGAVVSGLVLLFSLMVVFAVRQRKQRIDSIRSAARQHRAEQKRLQRQLTQQIIAAQERERESIGRELHDNVNQVLTTVKLYLELIQTDPAQGTQLLPRSISYLQNCISDIRNLSRELSAPTLGTRSIVDAINALVEMVARSGLAIEFSHEQYQQVLPKEQKLALYRILQEQINNIQKHSGASKVHITLAQDSRETTLRIADNGRGFDPTQQRGGIGLNNIRSRARALGGSSRIETGPGRGCTLVITLPLPPGEKPGAASVNSGAGKSM
jgi:signal transduction histidine kinase